MHNVMNWEVILEGYDFGNSHVKFRGENSKHYEIPSYFLRQKDLSVEDLEGETEIHTFQILNEGKDNEVYLWGEDIAQLVEEHKSAMITTNKEFERYEERDFETMAGISLAYTLYITKRYLDKAHLKIATGVPSDEKGLKDAPTHEEKMLKKVLENDGNPWKVKVNGELKEFTVEVVEIMPQARGTFYNQVHFLNGSNKENAKELYIKKKLVVDIGGGTAAADGTAEGKVILKYSGYYGVKRAYERIAAQLPKKLKATQESVELRVKRGDRVYKISENNKFEGFGEIVDRELEKLANDIVNNIQKSKTDFLTDNFDYIWIVGGGANLVGEYIKKRKGWEDAKIVENSQTSNVDGFFKRIMNLHSKKKG